MKSSAFLIKRLSIAMIFCIAVLFSRSQTGDSIRVYWNRHLVLNQVNTGKDTPVVYIQKGAAGNAQLSFNLIQLQPQKKWKRIFQLTDTVNNIILQSEFRYSSGNYVLPAGAIQSFLRKHDTMLAYSFVKPPAGAGTNIRVARFLLCKLIFQ